MLEISQRGDAFILEKTGLVYRGKNKQGKIIDKGIAFPVCISVNNYVCHYSPLPTEDKVRTLL